MAKKVSRDSACLRAIGNFVLRDDRCSALCPRGQEKGIIISDKYYLHLDSLLKVPISKREAKNYGKQMKFPLPTKEQIRLLQNNLEKVNNSLLMVGRGDCLLLGNVSEDFWTCRASSPQVENERRCVVFILPI